MYPRSRGFFYAINYNNKLNNSLTNIEPKFLLALAAAAGVKRKTSLLNNIIQESKRKKISYRKLYEVLLQNYLFAGYPNSMLFLKILRKNFSLGVLNKNDDMNLYHFKKIGEKNCKKVYGDKYYRLIKNVKEFSPDLAKWIVLEGYGKVLGRKALSLKQRELCIISALCALKYEDQLFSQINGAIRNGVSYTDVKKNILNLKQVGMKTEMNFGLKIYQKYLSKKGM